MISWRLLMANKRNDPRLFLLLSFSIQDQFALSIQGKRNNIPKARKDRRLLMIGPDLATHSTPICVKLPNATYNFVKNLFLKFFFSHVHPSKWSDITWSDSFERQLVKVTWDKVDSYCLSITKLHRKSTLFISSNY